MKKYVLYDENNLKFVASSDFEVFTYFYSRANVYKSLAICLLDRRYLEKAFSVELKVIEYGG